MVKRLPGVVGASHFDLVLADANALHPRLQSNANSTTDDQRFRVDPEEGFGGLVVVGFLYVLILKPFVTCTKAGLEIRVVCNQMHQIHSIEWV